MSNKWRYIDPNELIKRIDAASQPQPEIARKDWGYGDLESRVDRASARNNPLRKTPVQELINEKLLPEGFAV